MNKIVKVDNSCINNKIFWAIFIDKGRIRSALRVLCGTSVGVSIECNSEANGGPRA